MKIKTQSFFSSYTFGSLLFDLENDPRQETPIVDEAVERRMIGLMLDLMGQNDAPAEQYERLGLPVDGDIQNEHLFWSAIMPWCWKPWPLRILLAICTLETAILIWTRLSKNW